MGYSTTDRHTWPWPRQERAFAAVRYGRCMLPSAAQSSIGWSVRCTAGPISVVGSSCRPARSCSASVRPITPRGWCGPGVTGSMPQPRGCIDTLQPEAPRDNRIIFDAGAPAFAHHDRQAMLSLAEYAAAVGAETFLLDVGWCSRAGLDPYADSAGLTDTGSSADLDGLLTRIRDFDLEIGFAIELEPVEADSAIARDHPDWLLTVERDGMTRQVLDLSVRACDGVRVGEADQAARSPPRVIAELVDRHMVHTGREPPQPSTAARWRHTGCSMHCASAIRSSPFRRPASTWRWLPGRSVLICRATRPRGTPTSPVWCSCCRPVGVAAGAGRAR